MAAAYTRVRVEMNSKGLWRQRGSWLLPPPPPQVLTSWHLAATTVERAPSPRAGKVNPRGRCDAIGSKPVEVAYQFCLNSSRTRLVRPNMYYGAPRPSGPRLRIRVIFGDAPGWSQSNDEEKQGAQTPLCTLPHTTRRHQSFSVVSGDAPERVSKRSCAGI